EPHCIPPSQMHCNNRSRTTSSYECCRSHFAGFGPPAAIASRSKRIARVPPADAANDAGQAKLFDREAAVVLTVSCLIVRQDFSVGNRVADSLEPGSARWSFRTAHAGLFRVRARLTLRLLRVISLTGKSDSGEVKVASNAGYVNP